MGKDTYPLWLYMGNKLYQGFNVLLCNVTRLIHKFEISSKILIHFGYALSSNDATNHKISRFGPIHVENFPK